MKKIFTIQLLLLLTQINSFGQFKTSTVKDAILSADTVLLVSHNMTEQTILDEKTGKRRTSPPIVIKQRPNKKIIHETVLLSDTLKSALIKILTQPNNDNKIEMMRCFMPHHSILLIKNGKTSYIEICFGCEQLAASKDIGLNDIHYPKVMWKELENFFSSNGIKYQIPFNIEGQ